MQNTFLEFPFEYAEVRGLGRLFYSVVTIELRTVDGWRNFNFLVDTGADVTTVPLHLLPVLGLKKSQLITNVALGVGGVAVKTWEFRLAVRIIGKELVIHSSAVETRNSLMPLLLGRKDIFEEEYNLLLDSKRKVTVILEN